MKKIASEAVYEADIYLRLSDDDGDKVENNSIKNQREFIMKFLKSMPEIRIYSEKKDDGFSGVDFFRPGMQEVLQDVRLGIINCVVVKDLPRLRRNHIETGKVLQEFADRNVRLIAINDGYDTAHLQDQASTILLSHRTMWPLMGGCLLWIPVIARTAKAFKLKWTIAIYKALSIRSDMLKIPRGRHRQ